MKTREGAKCLYPGMQNLAASSAQFPQSWNAYAYVTNNPVNEIDPLGLFSWWKCTKECIKSVPGFGILCNWGCNKGWFACEWCVAAFISIGELCGILCWHEDIRHTGPGMILP